LPYFGFHHLLAYDHDIRKFYNDNTRLHFLHASSFPSFCVGKLCREDTLRKNFESAVQAAIAKRDEEISKLKNDWQKELDSKLREYMQIKEQEIQARYDTTLIPAFRNSLFCLEETVISLLSVRQFARTAEILGPPPLKTPRRQHRAATI
jgi:hypothetical protein